MNDFNLSHILGISVTKCKLMVDYEKRNYNKYHILKTMVPI